MSGEKDQFTSWDQVSNPTGFGVLHVLNTRDALLPPHLCSPYV